MLFKASEVQIEDTWYAAGLRGTGSHHFNVKEQFVPEGRTVILGGRARIKRPLYQFPMLGLLALGVSAVSLGIGYHALEAFKDLAGVKKPTGSRKTLIERHSVQADVARSIADLRSAESFIKEVIDEAWLVAESGKGSVPKSRRIYAWLPSMQHISPWPPWIVYTRQVVALRSTRIAPCSSAFVMCMSRPSTSWSPRPCTRWRVVSRWGCHQGLFYRGNKL